MLTHKTFSGVSFWAIDNDNDVTKDRNLNTFKKYCKWRKSGDRFPGRKAKKIVCMRVIALLAMLSLRLSDPFALVVGCINSNWPNLWKKEASKAGISPPLSISFSLSLSSLSLSPLSLSLSLSLSSFLSLSIADLGLPFLPCASQSCNFLTPCCYGYRLLEETNRIVNKHIFFGN